jgi:tetratricopeptide (TPR) repeat protein
MKKQQLFALAALSLPVLFFVVLEFALRLAPFYQSYPLFEEAPGRPDYLIVNSRFGEQYFANFTPSIAPMPFRKIKSDSSLRIVVFGGSSAAGFPYPVFASFGTRLQERLRLSIPQRDVEVINLAMTAVNSFQYVDMADEVLDIAPDVVLVYGGHNEFYGAYGAASTEGFGGIESPVLRRWMMKVKRLAVAQAVTSLPGIKKKRDTRTLMAKVVRDAQIPENSEMFNLALEGFSQNMNTIARRFSAAGIPVIVSTIGSNLSGQAPLGDSEEADSLFKAGQSNLAEGDSAAARALFEMARQADPLRFRAPKQINAIITAVSKLTGVHLVDGEAALRASGGESIEGNNVYTDHLHPDAEGHCALADVFFEKIVEVKGLTDHVMHRTPFIWQDVSRFENAYADVQIAKLIVDYPFVKNATPESSKMDYQQRAATIRKRSFSDSAAVIAVNRPQEIIGQLTTAATFARSAGDGKEFRALAVALSNWQIFNEQFYRKSIPLLMESGEPSQAAALLAVTAAKYHDDPVFKELSGAVFMQLKAYDAARFWLESALEENAKAETALYNLARLHVLQGDTASARAIFQRYKAVKAGN